MGVRFTYPFNYHVLVHSMDYLTPLACRALANGSQMETIFSTDDIHVGVSTPVLIDSYPLGL